MSERATSPGVLGSEVLEEPPDADAAAMTLARRVEELSEENKRLRELLRTAHVIALQGGWNTSDPDERADMAKIREALR